MIISQIDNDEKEFKEDSTVLPTSAPASDQELDDDVKPNIAGVSLEDLNILLALQAKLDLSKTYSTKAAIIRFITTVSALYTIVTVAALGYTSYNASKDFDDGAAYNQVLTINALIALMNIILMYANGIAIISSEKTKTSSILSSEDIADIKIITSKDVSKWNRYKTIKLLENIRQKNQPHVENVTDPLIAIEEKMALSLDSKNDRRTAINKYIQIFTLLCNLTELGLSIVPVVNGSQKKSSTLGFAAFMLISNISNASSGAAYFNRRTSAILSAEEIITVEAETGLTNVARTAATASIWNLRKHMGNSRLNLFVAAAQERIQVIIRNGQDEEEKKEAAVVTAEDRPYVSRATK